MKYVLLIILGLSTSFNLHCQTTFQILFEGEYPIDSDSSLFKTLDWYGFYAEDSLHQHDNYQKITLTIEYLDDYNGFIYKTKPSRIYTSNPNKSLFLLGIPRGEKLDFRAEHRCGRTDQYTYQESSLLPGRWVNWHMPTMSCSNLSIYALGSVEKSNKSFKLKDYRIFVDLFSFMDSMKTQEITKDLFVDSKLRILNPLGSVPYIYSTGDFDFDAKTDFILWNEGTFYLYLSKFADTDEIVKLKAKTKLKKIIDIITSTSIK